MYWATTIVLLLCATIVRGSQEESDEPVNSGKVTQLQSNRLSERSSEEEQIVFENGEFIRNEQDNCDLSGLWYNQHGSELFITQSPSGQLTGEYRTNVESKEGNAGNTFSPVNGTVAGKLFSFHVVWRGGSTMTTWIGQCHQKCNIGFYRTKEAILHSSWMMTNSVDSCEQSWSANRIGQDSFVKRPLRNGPRRSLDQNAPTRKT